jgi:hypothetical protein
MPERRRINPPANKGALASFGVNTAPLAHRQTRK